MERKGHQSEPDCLNSLQIGHQAVCLYDGEQEKIELIEFLLSHAIRNRLKVVCLLSEADQALLIRRFRVGHQNAEMLVQKGALAFLLSEEIEMGPRSGRSFRDVTVFVETAARRAIAQGYEGVCFLEVMAPFLEAKFPDELLLEHEMALRRSSVAPSSLGIAFYPRDTKRTQLLFEVLRRPNWLIFRDPATGGVELLPDSFVLNAGRNSATLAQMVETLTATSGAEALPTHLSSSLQILPTQEAISPSARDCPERKEENDSTRVPTSWMERINRGHTDLAHARTEQEAVQILLRVLSNAVPNAAAWVALKSEGEGAAFRIVAFHGVPETFIRALDLSAESEGPFAESLQTRRPVRWRSNSSTSGFRGPMKFRETMVFPILDGEKVWGAAALYLSEELPETELLSRWIQVFLSHAGARFAAMAERADIERRLRARHLPASCLLAPSAPPLAAFSPEGMLLYANPPFLAMWDAGSLADLPGRSWAEMASDPDQAASLWKMLRSTGIFRGEVALRTSQGGSRLLQVEIALQYNEVSEPLRAVMALVPERGRGEKTALVERTRSALLAGVSHELFTPLNAVIGFSEMLLEPSAGPLTEKQAEYLRHVLENGLRLQKLFERMLALADESEREEPFGEKAIPLYPLVKEILESFQERQKGKRPPPMLAVGDRARVVTVRIEPNTFRALLDELLDNAAKFTPPTGAILVTARVMASSAEIGQDPGFPPPYRIPDYRNRPLSPGFPCVELVVADEGRGIESDQLETIFEPFATACDLSTKRTGLGLGLSVARKTLERWNGQLWAESEGTGKGSRFVCILACPTSENHG